MARLRVVRVSALNIAMHRPHSAEGYVSLMLAAFHSERIVRLGKLHAAMIGSLYAVDGDNFAAGLTGEIYRFLKLDPSEPWFNAETKKAATEDEVGSISIPEHLLPHLQRIPFHFDPRSHRLAFTSKIGPDTLSPATAKRVLDQLFAPLVEEGAFPTVNVTVIPDHESVDKILRMPMLRVLEINLVRPNADDAGDLEERLMRKLDEQKAKQLQIRQVAESGESLLPDDETKAIARVAASNGYVRGDGKDAYGLSTHESTKDAPLAVPFMFNPSIETVFDVLSRMIGSLRRR